jgi:hypothetical protein
MNRRRVGVVGVPRSGTRYVHWMLRAAGLDVWHERMGPDGTVSGLFVFDHDYAPGPHRRDGDRPQDYTFDHPWALVRDPLRSIPSLAQVFQYGELAEFYAKVGVPMHGSDMACALRVWTCVYQKLRVEGWYHIRVEDFNCLWPDLVRPMGLPTTLPNPGAQNWSHGLSPKTWDQLFALDRHWAPIAYDVAQELGYG